MVMRGFLSSGARQPSADAANPKHTGCSQFPCFPLNRFLFRDTDIVLPTLVAIAYVLVAYALGLILVADVNLAFLPGVLLLAHSMVIAAFLLHECAHGSLFIRQSQETSDPHRMLAYLMAWLTGSCYSDFSSLRNKHLRHHFERADIVVIDYRQMLENNRPLRILIQTGQWLCLPAIELLFHVLGICRPLTSGDSRQLGHVLAVLFIRSLYFLALGLLLGWPVLFGYILAYMIFITVMGFMDAFQHQYLLLTGLEQPRNRSPVLNRERFPAHYFSRDYEQQHTFSNLISRRWPWLNLLVLNFCYHNAHHFRPGEAWWRLPRLHQELAEQNSHIPGEIPLREQLRLFFRYRVERVMAPVTDDLSVGRAPGAAGVSFLTPL